MPRLKLILCDPAVRKVQQGPRIWFVSGALPGSDDRLRTQAHAHDGQLERDICQSCGDVSIVKLTHDEGGRPRQLTLWRGLTSAFLLFTTRLQNGDTIVSDSFRAVIASLPPSMRSPSEGVIVDHFLFGNVSGENTYSEHVKRILHGQEVVIDLETGARKSQFFDKVPLSRPERSTDRYLEAIDRSLADFAKSHVTPGDSVVLFSGGIDSTLMGCYTGRALPYIHMRTRPTTLNARLEQQYCDDAAALLGVKCDVIYEELERYPDQLAACTDSLGSPPQALHMAWFDDVFWRTDYKKYFLAERADALFGHGGRLARFAAHFTTPAAFAALRVAAAILPRSNRFKTRQIVPVAQRLREPPESVYGYAAQASMRTTPQLVWKMFPRQKIEERLNARLQYALERVELPAHYESRFLRHFEIAQWIDYFCEDTLPLYRQCAHAHRKSALSPFLDEGLLRIAAEVPGDRRYIKDGQGKYLLKNLLKGKLPAYPVNQRKAFPEVPFHTLYPKGPLRGIWERYPLPGFIDKAERQEITANAHLVSWQAIKYAIWDKNIRAAEGLGLPPASVTLEFNLLEST